MMHAVFSQALCHNASIRSYHEIFKSEPLHFPGFWLAKYVWSSLLLASFISGWPGLLASSSFSATGWTSSTCWRCSPTTWSWAWPTWRPGPGRTSRERESYRASWWTMSHTGQYGSILYSDIGGRAHAMNWVQWPNVVYTKLFYDNNVMYIFLFFLFMISFLIPAPELMEEEEDNFQGVLQVFRVFKLARILKLAR